VELGQWVEEFTTTVEEFTTTHLVEVNH